MKVKYFVISFLLIVGIISIMCCNKNIIEINNENNIIEAKLIDNLSIKEIYEENDMYLNVSGFINSDGYIFDSFEYLASNENNEIMRILIHVTKNTDIKYLHKRAFNFQIPANNIKKILLGRSNYLLWEKSHEINGNICILHNSTMQYKWFDSRLNLSDEWNDFIHIRSIFFPNSDDLVYKNSNHRINGLLGSQHYLLFENISEISQYVCYDCNNDRDVWIENNRELKDKWKNKRNNIWK